MVKVRLFIISLLALVALMSCESKEQRNRRLEVEKERRIAYENEQAKIRAEQEQQREQEKREKEEKKRLEALRQAEYDKYISNSLSNGATPYRKYYGGNSVCNGNGCSQIKIKTPQNADVLAIVKQNDKVVRHAYIKSGNQFTFSMPNGSYQVFFYYGNGWNPTKKLSDSDVKGGFVANELFSKDYEQHLRNNILEYELILQRDGNFSAKPSSIEEMF